MKITQDTDTGQISYRLGTGEEFSAEEHLAAISEFLSTLAVETFRLRNSYRKLVYRLDKLELEEFASSGTSTIDK